MTTYLIVAGALVFAGLGCWWTLRKRKSGVVILTPSMQGVLSGTLEPTSQPESLVIYTKADMNPELWERTGQSSFGKAGWRRKKLDTTAPYKIEPAPDGSLFWDRDEMTRDEAQTSTELDGYTTARSQTCWTLKDEPPPEGKGWRNVHETEVAIYWKRDLPARQERRSTSASEARTIDEADWQRQEQFGREGRQL